jgi:hypothetical protein
MKKGFKISKKIILKRKPPTLKKSYNHRENISASRPKFKMGLSA